MKVLLLILFMVCTTIGHLPVDPDKFRVIGGVPAKADQAPWQISITIPIKSGDSHICGGSLIDPKTVLTAAHCCDGKLLSDLKVKYGGLDRTKLKYSTSLDEIKIHPDWNPNTLDYDFCILRLNKTVKEDKNIKMVAIADKTPLTGTEVQLTGWGKTSATQVYLPNHMNYITMKVLSLSECKNKLKDITVVTIRMICANNDFGTSCNGDSGGPLIADSKLVGLVSWGPPNCTTNATSRPSVSSNPVVVKKWIEKNTI